MSLNYRILFLSVLLISACQEQKVSFEEVAAERNFPTLFQQILEAHGGWEQWNKMHTLTFEKGTGEKKEMHTVDLKNRKSLIEVKDYYALGSDGESVWVSPNKDAFPGPSPRFMHNLYFYFAAIPFVLADPGVNYEVQADHVMGNKRYRVLKTSFKEDIGDAPDDQYWLYFDPKTQRIDFITYSVTYFDSTKANQFNALRYEWMTQNGLLVPKTLIGYEWQEGKLGKERYRSPLAAMKYSEEKASADIFKVPAGAHTE